MENKVTISELPELFYAEGNESIPVDSYDPAHEKNRTFQLKIDVIRDYIESKLNFDGAVTEEQILAWDAKETPQGAQDKVDAGLVLAKEYTDQELVAIQTTISNLTDLLASDDVALDELQEIVDFIKLNRSDLDSLTTASIAGLDDALELKADVSALESKADVSALEDKVDLATMNSALEDKVDLATMNSALEDKADVTALEGKADVSALANKADVSALESKADVSALESKADVSALDDKADVKNSFEVVSTDKTIVNADAGKILYITEDCILTVSDYDSLDDGFNCKIVVDAGVTTVAVAFTGTDSVRGDHTEITEDTTLIKTPNAGEFVFFGK